MNKVRLPLSTLPASWRKYIARPLSNALDAISDSLFVSKFRCVSISVLSVFFSFVALGLKIPKLVCPLHCLLDFFFVLLFIFDFKKVRKIIKTRIAELSSGAPWVRKFGYSCMREILVVTWPYALPPVHPSFRPHHRVTNVKWSVFLCRGCNLCLTWS